MFSVMPKPFLVKASPEMPRSHLGVPEGGDKHLSLVPVHTVPKNKSNNQLNDQIIHDPSNWLRK